MGSCQASVTATSASSSAPLTISTEATKRAICTRLVRMRASLGWTNGRIARKPDRADSGLMAPMDSRATDVAAPRGLRGATADRTTMARTLAYLFFAGAALVLLSIALPRAVDLPEVAIGARIASVVATLAAFAVALRLRGRLLLTRWQCQLTLALGTALVTAAFWHEGAASRYAVLYV